MLRTIIAFFSSCSFVGEEEGLSVYFLKLSGMPSLLNVSFTLCFSLGFVLSTELLNLLGESLYFVV